jgi:imidazolonepropionase-like amidohydrolase
MTTNREMIKAVKAGWVIDGSGGPAGKNMLMTLAGSEISSLGHAAIPVQGDDDIVDFADCTLLPGLIDAHVHLFMSGTYDPAIREGQLQAGFDTVRGDIARRLKTSLEHGIVAVRDGGDRHGHALMYKTGHLDSQNMPVKVFTAGRAWRRAGRYGTLIGRDPGDGHTLAAAIKGSREKVNHVKIVNSGLNSLVQFGKQTLPQFSLEEMTAAVASAKKKGLKTMVHANGIIPVDIAIKAGCNSIEHGFFMGRDNLARMAEQQTVWVPTAVTMQAYIEYMKTYAGKSPAGTARVPAGAAVLNPVEGARRNLDHQLEQMAMARQLGVPVAVGTDAGSPGVDHGTSLKEEIALLIEVGYSIPEAVRSATRIGGQFLGLGGTGRLAVGDSATFVAIKGPPEDIPHSLTKIKGLFIDGKRIV